MQKFTSDALPNGLKTAPCSVLEVCLWHCGLKAWGIPQKITRSEPQGLTMTLATSSSSVISGGKSRTKTSVGASSSMACIRSRLDSVFGHSERAEPSTQPSTEFSGKLRKTASGTKPRRCHGCSTTLSLNTGKTVVNAM